MKLTVNGIQKEAAVEDEMPLLWVLRETFGLTGTQVRLRSCRAHRLHGARQRCSGTLVRNAGRRGRDRSCYRARLRII